MSNLAVYESREPERGGGIEPHEPLLINVPDLLMVAEHLHKSGLYKDIANPSAAFALLLRSTAEGVHPGLALAQYHVIGGQPCLRADAMHARFLQAGGRVKWVTLTDQKVEGIFCHPEYAPEGVSICHTLEQHMRTGVAKGKDNWAKWPRAMLRCRVIAEGVRTVHPGIIVGLYTPEELGEHAPEPAPAPRASYRAIEASLSPELGRLHGEIQEALVAYGATDDQLRKALTARGVARIEELDWTGGTDLLRSLREKLGRREAPPWDEPAKPVTVEAEAVSVMPAAPTAPDSAEEIELPAVVRKEPQSKGGK